MTKYLTPEERLEKAVSWLRDTLRGCTDLVKQLRTITTVCAKWKVDKVKAREAVKDLLHEPKTADEQRFADDLWYRQRFCYPKRKK